MSAAVKDGSPKKNLRPNGGRYLKKFSTMKHANTIQWAVIALALGAGLVVWLRHKPSPPLSGVIPPSSLMAQIPEPREEAVSSNQVLVGVAPIQFQSATHLPAATAQAIAAKAWAAASDLLATIDGVKISRSTHPPVVVAATILDLHDERSQFKGYNIQSQSITAHCSLRVQVLDSATGSIAYTKTLDGEKADTQNSYGSTASPEDARQFAAVTAALQRLVDDPDFKNAVLQFRSISTNSAANPHP